MKSESPATGPSANAQPRRYREAVLPPSVGARVAVEAGSTQGWRKYVGDAGDVIGVDRFGASAPGEVVMREYGFTVGNVCKRARELLKRARERASYRLWNQQGKVRAG